MPRHRPPLALRVLSALLGVVALTFTAALMLSDRAPGVLQTLFGDHARRLWSRIDADERTRLFQEQAQRLDGIDTGPDFLIHVVLWAVVMLLAAVAVWSWLGLVVGGVATFTVSAAVELAQGEVTDTRTVQQSDILANGLGVAIGASIAALLYLAWSTLGVSFDALFRRRPSR